MTKRVPTIIAWVIGWVGIAALLTTFLPGLLLPRWWWILGILGVTLSVIGGFFARSRVVSWGIIIAGAAYTLYWAIKIPVPFFWLVVLPPGIIAVICGCALLKTRRRGWRFLVVFAILVAALLIWDFWAFGLFNRAPEYQPVELQPPEAEGGEVTLLGQTGGYYRLVTTEKDGSTREYLRLRVQGASSTYIEVRAPLDGRLMYLAGVEDEPLDQISVPAVGYEGYHEHTAWSFHSEPACVSYTTHGNDERYVIFRLKEHIPGERLIIEYRYAMPSDQPYTSPPPNIISMFDSLELVSINPVSGTVLKKGYGVQFTVTVNYELEYVEKAVIKAHLGVYTHEMTIGSFEVQKGAGTAVIEGYINLDSWLDFTDKVYLGLSFVYQESSGKNMLLMARWFKDCFFILDSGTGASPSTPATTSPSTTSAPQPPELNFNAVTDGLYVMVNGGTRPVPPGTTITRIHFDWGDGDSEDNWFPAYHRYSQGGIYTVMVTSYQSNGLSTAKSITVTVNESESPPEST